MKYSYNWLRELTRTRKSVEELIEMIGLRGFEFDGAENLAERFENFKVGEILEVKKHPNADKLQIAKVRVSQSGRPLSIVCGAPNICAGQKVPVALVRAVIPKGGFRIEKSKIRGAESQGMLCAEDELGIGKDHSGILILSPDAKVGQDLARALGLDDVILEFDVLPNRAHDCLSYQGMAREISAMEGKRFKFDEQDRKINSDLEKSAKFSESRKAKDNFLKIEIKDQKLCPRYFGAVLDEVEIKSSPDWIRARLIASGMEPINNVVDITNYVMLEIGSPLHAFDFEKIKTAAVENQGKNKNKKEKENSAASERAEIIVRRAKEKEKLELLDGTKLSLSEKDLVITNPEKILALAGIKGGKDSGIAPETRKIVLEAANFEKLNIRKSRQRHSLLTESQARFEKGLSPVLAEKAFFRAVELLQKYANAKLIQAVDQNYFKPKKQLVELKFEYADRLLGSKIPKKKIESILTNLGFSPRRKTATALKVEVPFWRLDIESEADLVEEAGRIVGYEKIKEAAIQVPVEIPRKNLSRSFEWKLRDSLSALGFFEMINYSFYADFDIDFCGVAGEHFELENPLSEDQKFLRRTLLPGLLRNVELNSKNFDRFSLFELGKIYFPDSSGRPVEELRLSGVFFDQNSQDENNFYFLKGKIEELFENNLEPKVEVEFRVPEKIDLDLFHPSRCALIILNGEIAGVLGQARKEVAKKYGLKKTAIAFELDFESLFELQKQAREYQEMERFPRVLRDLSLFVRPKKEAAEVIKIIKKAGAEKLLKVELFDIFVEENKKEENKKSLAFHLEFGQKDRTMSGKEVGELLEKIAKELEKTGAEVRRGA